MIVSTKWAALIVTKSWMKRLWSSPSKVLYSNIFSIHNWKTLTKFFFLKKQSKCFKETLFFFSEIISFFVCFCQVILALHILFVFQVTQRLFTYGLFLIFWSLTIFKSSFYRNWSVINSVEMIKSRKHFKMPIWLIC